MLCRSIVIRAMVLIAVSVSLGCQSPYYAHRGAAAGGLTGAGLGALVGESAGRPAAGALVGGAVGALTGAVIGQGLDDVRNERQAIYEQQATERVTTLHDVLAMSQAGLSHAIIVGHVQSHGFAGPLTASDLIQLKQAGVSDEVVHVLQSSPPPPSQTYLAAAAAPPEPVTVIIDEPPPPIVFHGFCDWRGPGWGPRGRHCR